MCVIFFYVNSNPNPGGYKLILASNRDEFYARDTQDAAKWANAEHVYGGLYLSKYENKFYIKYFTYILRFQALTWSLDVKEALGWRLVVMAAYSK